MQKIRIFYPDNNGNVSFSKEELEKLINEVYQEGYNDAKSEWCTITYPNTTPYNPLIPYYTTTSESISTGDAQTATTITNNTQSPTTYATTGTLADGKGTYKVSATCANPKDEVDSIIGNLKKYFGE